MTFLRGCHGPALFCNGFFSLGTVEGTEGGGQSKTVDLCFRRTTLMEDSAKVQALAGQGCIREMSAGGQGRGTGGFTKGLTLEMERRYLKMCVKLLAGLGLLYFRGQTSQSRLPGLHLRRQVYNTIKIEEMKGNR